MTSFMPIRVRPASASTTASYSPLITFFTLVSTLPLIGLTLRSGLYLASCTARRRLLVPTTEPGASSLSFRPLSLTSTSFGLALFGMHATTSSSDRSDGTSFKLWTAKSASPFLTASLTSFSKIPFSSMVKSGRLSTSPLVFIVITSKRTPACTQRYLCLRYRKPAAPSPNSYSLHFFILRKASPYASMVLSVSSSLCAYETKQVSNCEGGMNTSRFISSSNSLRNIAVFDFLALASSFTFSLVKNSWNIEPIEFSVQSRLALDSISLMPLTMLSHVLAILG